MSHDKYLSTSKSLRKNHKDRLGHKNLNKIFKVQENISRRIQELNWAPKNDKKVYTKIYKFSKTL